jgi:hypothetical protein
LVHYEVSACYWYLLHIRVLDLQPCP